MDTHFENFRFDDAGLICCPNCIRGRLCKPEFADGSVTVTCPKCRKKVKIEAFIDYRISFVVVSPPVTPPASGALECPSG